LSSALGPLAPEDPASFALRWACDSNATDVPKGARIAGRSIDFVQPLAGPFLAPSPQRRALDADQAVLSYS
jgi:hypothetical protein